MGNYGTSVEEAARLCTTCVDASQESTQPSRCSVIRFISYLTCTTRSVSTKRCPRKRKSAVSPPKLITGVAMLGIFAFLSADQVPGSVPALTNIAIPYSGDIMAPLQADFSFFSDAV